MKSISPIFLFLLLLFSCGKEKKLIPNGNSSISPTLSRAGFSDSSGQKLQDLSEALADQIPISNEQLKDWIPEKIGEMVQHKLLVGHKQSMGMSGAISTYHEEISEEQQVSMEVLDGAGAIGAVMLKSIIQKLVPDYEEQKANGYSRIYERDGLRVWEKFNTLDQTAEIEYVLDGRFHFIFKGHQIELDELWAFVREVKKEMS